MQIEAALRSVVPTDAHPDFLAQLVVHGDLLSERKETREGLLFRSEREQRLPNTLLITGWGFESLTTHLQA